MTTPSGTDTYFPHEIQISSFHWRSLDLGVLSSAIKERGIPQIQFFRQLAFRLNSSRAIGSPVVHAGELNLYASLQKTLRFLIDDIAQASANSLLINAAKSSGFELHGREFQITAKLFVELFSPAAVLEDRMDAAQWLAETLKTPMRSHQLLREMLLLNLAAANPAIESFRELVDDSALSASSHYSKVIQAFNRTLENGPVIAGKGCTLIEAIKAAISAAPESLVGQVAYLRREWNDLLPPELLLEVEIAFDILQEEQRERGGGGGDPGPAPVLEFRSAGNASGDHFAASDGNAIFHGFDYPEYEHFSPDASWMSHVVMMAKMVYVWLDQLSRSYDYPITRLDQIPDKELD